MGRDFEQEVYCTVQNTIQTEYGRRQEGGLEGEKVQNNQEGFPGGSDSKESACNVGDAGSIPAAAAAKLLQSCPTLCDTIDGSPPGSPIPGILQAITLEWVAISFSNA